MSEYDIHVSFKKGTKAVAKEQFQYNYGEKLIFDDVDLPEYYEVHFANTKIGEAKKVIGDATGAIIPQEYFKPGQIIYAWVFFSNETSGKTVYEIVIPIARRAKPTDEPITPEEKSVVSQAIELLNETVENVEESINSSLEEAKNSGEFDGKDGVDGSTQWISSRAPVNPNYTFYIYALSGTTGSRVKVNDTIFYENNLYQIISVDSFQVRSILLANLKGDPGSFPESDAFLSDTSRNPVQNRIVKAAIDSKYTKPTSGVPATDLSDDVQESLRKADSSIDADRVYTKTEIDQKLVGAMTYKGTKARVSDLPMSGNAKGDTWHINEDGSEWAWNGLVWEELGRAVDLSGYRTAAAQDLIDQNQNDRINSKYTKPANGIPKSDLESAVQTSLGKADTALQADNIDEELDDQSDNPVANWVLEAVISRLRSDKLDATGNAYRAASIPMGELDSTSTATVMTATVPGITELRDGVCVWLRNGVIASASGVTLNINSLGAKPIYNSLSGAVVTTTFTAASTYLFVYNSTRVTGGCWDMVYGYDTNTTYTPPKLGFGYGVCSTAAATVAKVVSISNYTLVPGGIVAIKFNEDVPAGASLNINSKGAKVIFHKGAAITGGVIKAGDTVTMVYSTYYHVISIDRALPQPSDSTPARIIAYETPGNSNEYARADHQHFYDLFEALADLSASNIPVFLYDGENSVYIRYSPQGLAGACRSQLKMNFALVVPPNYNSYPVLFTPSKFDTTTGELHLTGIVGGVLYEATLLPGADPTGQFPSPVMVGTMTTTDLTLPSAQGVSF